MTNTFTTTSSFTLTHAKYLASKVAADLKQMQIYYNAPDDERIYCYIEEVVILILGGYLESVTYGFKRNGNWIAGTLRYNVSWGGISSDESSGRVSPNVDITDAYWSSYLVKSSKFFQLSADEQAKIEAKLPISRTAGDAPGVAGRWCIEKTYSSGNGTLNRLTLKLL